MADIAMLSILWTICSIPVITMGAASAALMRCVLNMNTEEGNWRSRHFFRYFRSNRIQRIIAVIGMIIWMITAVWAFALTSQFENGIFQTIKNAFYLGISWLPRTLVMCVLWLVPVALLAFAPFILSRIIVLWPALLFGGTAYFCSKLMMKPLAPYFDFELPDRSGPDE